MRLSHRSQSISPCQQQKGMWCWIIIWHNVRQWRSFSWDESCDPWSEWRREREGEDVYVSLADYSTVDLQAVKCLATQAVCLQGAFKGIPMLAVSWITLIISKSIRRIDETMWQPIMHLDFNQFGIDHISEINKIMSHPVELFAACCSSLWFCLLEMLSLLC